MDSLITSAALALARGDSFGALNRVALRDDPPALALRGIAMAQLGDLERAKFLLRKAGRGFGNKQLVSRARCVLAEIEIAIALRDLDGSAEKLESAYTILHEQGDFINAAYAQHLRIRLLVLFGKLNEADELIKLVDTNLFSPGFKAAHELVIAGISIRRLRTQEARAAIARAQSAIRLTPIPSLDAEISKASRILQTPAARLISSEGDQKLLLEDVEVMLASNAIVVDVCRYVIRQESLVISLASRPILFNLLQALGEAWPKDLSRDQLIKIAFRQKRVDESLRARLRVEIGRLRAEISLLTEIKATAQGFMLVPRAQTLVVLQQPIQEKYSAIVAILADGEAWSSSALALVLGISQRSVQRALDSLARSEKVQSFGRGQARRWITMPLPGVTTILLLPGPYPGN
jgi:hypothetical protein